MAKRKILIEIDCEAARCGCCGCCGYVEFSDNPPRFWRTEFI